MSRSSPWRSRARVAVTAAAAVVCAVGPASASAREVVNLAKRAGLADLTSTYGAAIADVNRDGRPDVLLNRHWQHPMQLFIRNGEGRYVERRTFHRADRHGCAWGDVDRNGRPDLYCAKGATHDGANVAKQNELWMQSPDGGFTDQAAAYGVTDPDGRGREVTFLHANGDGYPDLFVGNLGFRLDGTPSRNRLFLNVGGEHFRDSGDPVIGRQDGASCALPVDVDGDRRRELVVCTRGDDGGPVVVYRPDDGGRFHDVTHALGITLAGRDAAVNDLNGDRRRDIAAVEPGALRVQLARADGTFRDPVRIRRLEAGVALAVRDVDRDGDRDIFVVQGCAGGEGPNQPDRLLLNRGGGTEFRGARLRQVERGCGGSVEPLRYGRRPAFLVLNGAGRHPGPVQLLAFR